MSLSLKDVSAGYGPHPVVRDINVEAAPGQFIALVGPNGSGKSTLIKAMAGLLPRRTGDIWIGNTPLSFLEPRERAQRIAYLAQDRTAQPAMTVAEILELGRAPYRGRLGRISEDGQVAINRAAELTDLQTFLTRPFGELSGGEQARVLLARTLVVDAPILLADEPNAALDPYYQLSTLGILKREAEAGKTVITALHNLSLARKFADTVWVLHEGALAAAGPTDKVLTDEMLRRVFKVDDFI